jgi:hypothetical protein
LPQEKSSQEEDYYAAVERHFVDLRGSPLFITPKEWQLIHNWRRMQIPLHVVKDGLTEIFGRPKRTRPIRRLGYCRQTVEAAYRRHCEALTGARRGEAETDDDETQVQSYLVRLENELRQVRRSLADSHPELAEHAERSAEDLARLAARPTAEKSFQTIEHELGRMDEELIKAAESCLEEDESRRCMGDAERSLMDYQERMPEDVYRSAVRSAYLKRVRAHFGLPALSLFYL